MFYRNHIIIVIPCYFETIGEKGWERLEPKFTRAKEQEKSTATKM